METVWLALGGLGLSAFCSATFLPAYSEVAFSAFLYKWPEQVLAALLIASLANALGGITVLLLGHRLPAKPLSARISGYFQRFGPALLLLSWLPLIGDTLPLAAGWLRLPRLPCMIWLTVGKTLRYLVLAWGVLAVLHAQA